MHYTFNHLHIKPLYASSKYLVIHLAEFVQLLDHHLVEATINIPLEDPGSSDKIPAF